MKAKSRPDFILRVNSVLIMWGEEKQASMQGALEDLKNKFGKLDPLHFGGIKFMICHAGAGPHIRFYTITIDGSTKKQANPLIIMAITPQFDISSFQDRVAIICTVINIARIIVT